MLLNKSLSRDEEILFKTPKNDEFELLGIQFDCNQLNLV